MKKKRPTPKKRIGAAPDIRNRKTFLRIYEMDALLRTGKCPNATRLAKKFEVTRGSITRDFEFMRESMGLPVVYDRRRRIYSYGEEPPPLPELQLNEGDLFGLCVMEQMLSLFQGTELEPQLRSTFGKLSSGLTEHLAVSWEAVAEVVSFRATSIPVPVNPEVLDTVRNAARDREEIEFLYSGLNDDSPGKRRAEPFHILVRDGIWYVFTYDLDAEEIRTFALLRMSQVQRTGRHFEKGERHIDPDIRLQHSIGIFSGNKPELVHLRLNKLGARLLSERSYHPTQKITRGADGRHELTMEVHITPELERWVMTHLSEVEVLAPASLRQQIQKKARAVLAWE